MNRCWKQGNPKYSRSKNWFRTYCYGENFFILSRKNVNIAAVFGIVYLKPKFMFSPSPSHSENKVQNLETSAPLKLEPSKLKYLRLLYHLFFSFPLFCFLSSPPSRFCRFKGQSFFAINRSSWSLPHSFYPPLCWPHTLLQLWLTLLQHVFWLVLRRSWRILQHAQLLMRSSVFPIRNTASSRVVFLLFVQAALQVMLSLTSSL